MSSILVPMTSKVVWYTLTVLLNGRVIIMLSKIQAYSLFKSGLLWQFAVDSLFFLANS